MKRLGLVHFVCLVLLLVACSQTFFVNVDGDLASGFRFCFYGDLSDAKPEEHEIRELGVERLTDRSWKNTWTIEGPFEATCLFYGAESGDYRTLVQAEPLQEGARCRISASDRDVRLWPIVL